MVCCLCDKSNWIRLLSDKIKQERRMEYILALILEMLGKEDMSFLSKTV
jgi:RNA binding exosome subunit